MIDKEIIDHWILLEQNLNIQLKFTNRPLGNTTEVKHMDSNLNKDFHEGVNCICCISNLKDNSKPDVIFLHKGVGHLPFARSVFQSKEKCFGHQLHF